MRPISLAGILAALFCALSGFGQGFTLDNDGRFSVRTFQLGGAAANTQVNNTNEALDIWDLNPTGTGPLGDYNVANYETDLELRLDYNGGHFSGALSYATINSDGPGGGGGSMTGGNDFSVRGEAYLAVPIGTWSIAAGSDDGRWIHLDGLAGLATANFTTVGGQISGVNPGSGAGTEYVGFNGTTGHNWSVGTFTVGAADVEPGSNVALLRLDTFMFERGGGDSFELAIRGGADTSVSTSGEGWTILDGGDSLGDPGTLGWFVSSTPITVTPITSSGELYWDGGAGNWTDTGADAWDTGSVGGGNSPDFPTASPPSPLDAFVTLAGSDVAVTGAQSAFNLTVSDGAVNIAAGGGNSLDVQVNAVIDSPGVVNVGSGATFSAFDLSGDGTVNLAGATLAADSVDIGTLGVTTGNSALTLPSNATATIGTLNLGNQLTLNSDMTASNAVLSGTGTINQAGGTTSTLSNVSGSGNLVKTGSGDLTLPTANTYTGTTTVQDGRINVNADGALGTTAGGTVVNNGRQIVLAPNLNYATPEPLQLHGAGISSSGALRSSGNSSFAGPITLSDSAEIQSDSGTLSLPNSVTIAGNRNLTFDGGGSFTVAGDVGESGGDGRIIKNGTGTLELGGNNSYTGSTTINAGTVVATNDNSFGTTAAGTSLGSGTSLELVGATTGEDFDLGSGTSIRGTGAATMNGAVAAAAGLDLGTTTAGSTLTINGPVTLGLIGDVDVGGPGDVVINSAFGNGNTPSSVSNALSHFGYHINSDGAVLDLDGNGGMMGGGNPADGPSFYGLSFLTDGPGNRGLDFNNDTDFINTGSIGQIDNYSNLFVGQLNVAAGSAGDWDFRRRADDDRMGIWLDLDQDGVFESSSPGLGSNRGEQLQWDNDNGVKTVNLDEGTYNFAVTHREGGGGSQIHVDFRSPTMGSYANIKPGDAAQAGVWESLEITPDNGINKRGEGTLTLGGDNTYGGVTNILAGTVVAAHNNALGVADGTAGTGTVISGNASLVLDGGVNVGNEQISGGDFGGTMSVLSQGGANSLAGNIDMNISNLEVGGTSDLTIGGVISGTNLASASPVPGLLYGQVGGNIDTTAYPGSPTVQLGPHVAQTNSGTAWPNNTTNVYWGQIYLDGANSYNFIESIDDKVWLQIDGTVYINDGSWSNTTKSGLISKASGWYDFELRMSNGGGGRGPINFNPGFQYNDAGIDSLDAADHVYPEDNGSGNLFRNGVTILPNDLVKTGANTVTLTGANTYVGATFVNGGTLIAANDSALGDLGMGTTVADGASLGLSGGVTIAEPITATGTGASGRSGAIVNVGGNNEISGVITAAGDFTIGADAGVLTVSAPLAVAGGTTLTKGGPGTVILTGPQNYAGDTAVSDGEFLINGDYSGGGVFTVTGGTLGGTGTISNGTVVTSGGFFSPGNSPGLMTVNNLVLDSSPYLWELYDTAAPMAGANAWDHVTITNSLTVNPSGSILALGLAGLMPDLAGVPLELDLTDKGDTTGPFDVLTLDGGATLLGVASLLDIPVSAGNLSQYGYFTSSLTNGGQTLQLTFVSTVPEPGTYALLGLTLLGLLAWRRKRS